MADGFNPDDFAAGNPPVNAGPEQSFNPEDFAVGNPEMINGADVDILGTVGPEEEPPGFFDIFTGESRMTPEMEGMPEIGAAPELNELSLRALKASAGLLSTGDTESLKQILNAQYGDQVNYTVDSRGNTIVHFPSGAYALNKPGVSGQDIIRGAFDIAAFTPAGKASSLFGAGVKATATGTGIEAIEAGTGGGFDIEDPVTAGFFGVAGKSLENILESGLSAYHRIRHGNAALPVVEAGERAGVPVLTSDVYPPQTFPGRALTESVEKVPMLGTAGVREAQQVAREEAVSDVIDKYGVFSYTDIVESLRAKAQGTKRAAGNVLEKVGNQLDPIGEVPLAETFKAMDDALDVLTDPKVIESSGAMKDLNDILMFLEKTPQNFTSLKSNRTAFREILKGIDKAERSQLPSRALAVLDRVSRGMTKDMENFAKEYLDPREFRQWKNANAVYFVQAQELTRSRLKNVLDRGDITPEQVETMLFSQKPSEVQRLYRGLTNEGRQNARAAIISKVANNLSRRGGGITPNSFNSEMKKYGLQTDTFFKGGERRALFGFLDLLNHTQRAQTAKLTTPTGQALLAPGAALAVYLEPSSLGVIGGIAGLGRVMESAPIRDALIKLRSIPKGSTRYEKQVQNVLEKMVPVIESLQRGADTGFSEEFAKAI